MSIVRIGTFEASAGQENALLDFLKTIVVPAVQSSEGCLSCQVLQSQDEAARFVVIEVWGSVEGHRASAQNIPPALIQQALALLAGPPTGEYYHPC